MMIEIRIVITSGRKGFLGGEVIKNPPANAGDREMQVQSLGWEDPLEEGMATHSSILAWEISQDRGTWWAAVHRVTKSLALLSAHPPHQHRLVERGIRDVSICKKTRENFLG